MISVLPELFEQLHEEVKVFNESNIKSVSECVSSFHSGKSEFMTFKDVRCR